MDKVQHAEQVSSMTTATAGDARQPYSAPQLTVYNTAEVTMTGVNPMGNDNTGPITFYKVS